MSATLKRSSESSAAELARNAYASALAALPLDYPHLQCHTPGAKLYGVTLAAANIRAMLKQAFPGVKFSVKTKKFSGGDSLTVNWTDGPTSKDVTAITNRFSAGHFDGSDDCYKYSSNAFTDLFGDSKYTHTSREQSDTLSSITR